MCVRARAYVCWPFPYAHPVEFLYRSFNNNNIFCLLALLQLHLKKRKFNGILLLLYINDKNIYYIDDNIPRFGAESRNHLVSIACIVMSDVRNYAKSLSPSARKRNLRDFSSLTSTIQHSPRIKGEEPR